MNDRKVPQMLVSTGATEFGARYRERPETMGWQPDYFAEGTDLRQVRRDELADEEDRRPLPERRLRQELPRRPQSRPRGEVDEHRQEVGVAATEASVASRGRCGYRQSNAEVVAIFGDAEPDRSRPTRR